MTMKGGQLTTGTADAGGREVANVYLTVARLPKHMTHLSRLQSSLENA
jgi:hypothetical protein